MLSTIVETDLFGTISFAYIEYRLLAGTLTFFITVFPSGGIKVTLQEASTSLGFWINIHVSNPFVHPSARYQLEATEKLS